MAGWTIYAFRRRNQGLVDEAGEQWHDIGSVDASSGADILRGGRREFAGKDGQPSKEHLLDPCKEPIAPLDRCLHGTLTGRQTSSVAGDQAESLFEASGDVRRRQGGHSCGGELDGERQAVKAAADRSDGASVVTGQDKLVRGEPGPIDEELDAAIPVCMFEFGRVVVRHIEWCDGIDELARKAELLPARRQHVHSRPGGE